MKNTALHIIFGAITFATGLAFVAGIQMVIGRLPAKETVLSEAPLPILRPVESVAPRELSCYDLNIAPVWKELKRDRTFQSRIRIFPGQYDCSDLIEVRREDLNGDNEPELIVWGKNTQLFCGATANCDVWIFGMRSGRMKRLLDSGGVSLESGKSKHNGFRNITVRFNGSSYPDSLLEYQFNGREFQLARCQRQDKQTLEKWEEGCAQGQ